MPAKSLSILDAKSVIEMLLPAVLKKPGLTESLQIFADQNSNRAGHLTQSIFDALITGAAFEQAIAIAQPSLPPTLQNLLILGSHRGALDFLLADMLKVYEITQIERQLAQHFRQLLQQWQSRPAACRVCDGCLEREIGKILRRASIEEASEIILEQEKERFLHHWYIGAKPIHLIEPSHSLTYKTILSTLSKAAKTSQSLQPWNLKVRQESRKKFHVIGNGIDLKIAFREAPARKN